MDTSIYKTRYTPSQHISLGYPLLHRDCEVDFSTPENLEAINNAVCGKFRNVIHALFDSMDGSLDNDIDKLLSENAPESVRSFVQNVLQHEVNALPSAPDDDTAFDYLIPSTLSTRQEIAPYLDKIVNSLKNDKASSTDSPS